MYTKIRNKTGFFFLGGGGISNFLERDKEGLPKFLTDEGGGGGVVFSPLT